MPDPRPHKLMDSNRRRLVRAATRMLDPADAEDAVQDAYVRALEADNRVEIQVAQAWLLTVTRNLAIDRLRRQQWMHQWLERSSADGALQGSPSAEMDASMAQEVEHAVRLLAVHLTPQDGAALLLHAVFEVSHAEIAQGSGRSEPGSRQHLRRALSRLRQAISAPADRRQPEPDSVEATVLRLYLQCLQQRDPQTLWAMLRQPPVNALAPFMPSVAAPAAARPSATSCGIAQVGGQLGLVLTLDGVRLCVVPLGVWTERRMQEAAQL